MTAQLDLDLPDTSWIGLLRAEAEKTSIGAAAAAIGYSRTAISLALAGKYGGDTKKIEKAVMARFANQVACPGLEQTIAMDVCADWSTRKFSSANGQRIHMYQACAACPNSKRGKQ